jgi:hypothetical protein
MAISESRNIGKISNKQQLEKKFKKLTKILISNFDNQNLVNKSTLCVVSIINLKLSS